MRTLGIAFSTLALVFALVSCKEDVKNNNVENDEKRIIDTIRKAEEKTTTDDSLKAKIDTGVVIEKKEEKAN